MSDPDWLAALNEKAPGEIVFKWENVGFGVVDSAGEPARELIAYRRLSSGHEIPLRKFDANVHEAERWICGDEDAGSDRRPK